jgi:hypothetical protein
MDAETFITQYERPNPGKYSARFTCPTCRSLYSTVREMEACYATTVVHGRYEVGDIVLVPASHLFLSNPYVRLLSDDPWFAGVRRATPHSRSHFDHVDHVHTWYVVTDFHQDGHDEVASLFTLYDGGNHGWIPTVRQSHHQMFTVEEVLSGSFPDRDGTIHGYWRKNLADVEWVPPSDTLRSEAAKLAAARLRSFCLL